MFGIFKKSKIVRKSDNLNDTTTKWFNGQKVKIKSGTTSQSSRRNQSRKPKNPTWFRETPLPVPSVEKKQMLISSSHGVSKVAILEGPTLVQYYSSDNIGKSKVGNIYLGKVKNVLPGMEAAFVSFGEDKNGLLVNVADINKLRIMLEKVFTNNSQWKLWSRNGVEGVHRHFSWNTHVRNYLSILTEEFFRPKSYSSSDIKQSCLNGSSSLIKPH